MVGPGIVSPRRAPLVTACLIAIAMPPALAGLRVCPASGAGLETGIQGIRRREPSLEAFPLMQIGALPYPVYGYPMPFGDSDHDGRIEVFLYDNQRLRVLEHQGNNVYTNEYAGPQVVPNAVADLDGDGRSELVAKYTQIVRVYESPSATTYPTQLVWSGAASVASGGEIAVADTDRDGRMEIVLFDAGLRIYENTGDNAFERVLDIPGGSSPEAVIADLDGDGLTEIALAQSGRFRVYESPADNVWLRTWSQYMELDNIGSVQGGRDTDGDGKPEIFITGSWVPEAMTHVYEATGNDQFGLVAILGRSKEQYFGGETGTLANLDGVGPEEFIMNSSSFTRIFQPVAPGHWLMVSEMGRNVLPLGSPAAFDVNGNGRTELFWRGGATVLILEHPGTPGLVGEDPWGRTTALSVFPNPSRGETLLSTRTNLTGPVVLSVFNAAGRLVDRRWTQYDVPGRLMWSARQMQSGVYLLRLEAAGEPVATGRATVLR